MNAIAEPFKQLIERRLWPIALLLVAALVAVPVLLKSGDEPTVLPSPVAAAPAGATADASVVTLSDAGKRDRVRAVLGDRKDPFRPAQLHRVPKTDDGLTGAPAATSVDVGGASGGGGGETTSPTDTPVAPAATPTPTPKPTFDLYSLKVRFGSTDGELVTRNVKRLTGLPGGTNPAVLYLGLLEDHKSAVFILDAGVQALGDGHCDPSPEDCQTLTLKKGETEFLTRGDKQWELDLVDIHVKKTTDAKAAKASRKVIAVDGRKKLRSMIGRIGALRYDEGAGSLERLPKAEQAKRVAKSRRVAALTSTG